MKAKRMIAGAMVVASAVLLVACGSKSSSSTETFNRMEKDVISTMDNAHITDVISGQAAVDTGDGLYRYKGKKLQPAVATKVVKPTNKGLTRLIYVRPNGATVILSRLKILFLLGAGQPILRLSQSMLICSRVSRTLTILLPVRRRHQRWG